jgi:hypothetical protein
MRVGNSRTPSCNTTTHTPNGNAVAQPFREPMCGYYTHAGLPSFLQAPTGVCEVLRTPWEGCEGPEWNTGPSCLFATALSLPPLCAFSAGNPGRTGLIRSPFFLSFVPAPTGSLYPRYPLAEIDQSLFPLLRRPAAVLTSDLFSCGLGGSTAGPRCQKGTRASKGIRSGPLVLLIA